MNNLQKTWFGKCIFISWYCDIATCKFCFRAHQKEIKTPEQAKRSMASILAEAFITKQLGWRIEFITGGCLSVGFDELFEIIKNVFKVYGKKLWINMGVFSENQLEQLRPYVSGICASIETTASELHDFVCPDKPIKTYEEMLKSLKGFKKSITIIIGLGETKEDINSLFDFIERNKLDRITFYALKPVKGSPYTKSPDTKYYAWWISETRKRFPELEIMAGLTPKKPEYAEEVLRAGASAITKFPAIRKFNSEAARIVEQGIKNAGRDFNTSLTKLPDVNWDEEINKIELDDKLKSEMKKVVLRYVEKMKRLKD